MTVLVEAQGEILDNIESQVCFQLDNTSFCMLNHYIVRPRELHSIPS